MFGQAVLLDNDGKPVKKKKTELKEENKSEPETIIVNLGNEKKDETKKQPTLDDKYAEKALSHDSKWMASNFLFLDKNKEITDDHRIAMASKLNDRLQWLLAMLSTMEVACNPTRKESLIRIWMRNLEVNTMGSGLARDQAVLLGKVESESDADKKKAPIG